MWFQCRPLESQSPLIWQLPYKFWRTWEDDKYSYTFTEQPDDVSKDMMASDIYKNVWRPNGYVVPFYPNWDKESMEPFYDSRGNFVYYKLVPLNMASDKAFNAKVKKEDKKIKEDIKETLEVKLESSSDIDVSESSLETMEEKPKTKRGRKKKSES